jgi:hypothetical protein
MRYPSKDGSVLQKAQFKDQECNGFATFPTNIGIINRYGQSIKRQFPAPGAGKERLKPGTKIQIEPKETPLSR